MYRAPSPLAAIPPAAQQATTTHPAQPAHSTHSAHSAHSSQSSARSQISQSSRPPVQSSRPSGSQASLSTTASTSSRTLKTPHAKLDYSQPQPTIASSSSLSSHGDYDGSPTPAMPLKDRDNRSELTVREARDTRSPTPTQRSVSARSAPSAAIMPQGPPPLAPNFAMPLHAAPAKTASHPFMTASSPPRPTGRTKGPPAPLRIRKNETRLSQDWVQVAPDVQDDYIVKARSPVRSPMSTNMVISPMDENAARSAIQKQGGQEPRLVPMKLESPLRPVFERASTAPTMSPLTPAERAQRQGRGSLDRLRSVSPNPPRPRQTSMSTPPAAILEAAQAQTTGGRLNIFRTGAVKTPPKLSGRKSEDLLRPSMDALRAAGSMAATGITKGPQDTKTASQEQQRALGVAHGASPMTLAADAERKSSGLSLKKSSGALKALFSRGTSGKGKDAQDAPPLPTLATLDKEKGKMNKQRPSTAPKDDMRKLSGGSRAVNPFEWSEVNSAEVPEAYLEQETGRKSFGSDRARYPAHPNIRPVPAMRAASYGPSDYTPSNAGPRQRLPSRGLPAVPLPSPVGQQSHHPASPQVSMPAKTGSSESMEEEKPQHAKLGETLPSTSLPYLSPLRDSFLLESQGPQSSNGQSGSVQTPETSETASSDPGVSLGSPLSPDTERATPPSFLDEPMKTSKSLHLLQLPDLDLDFSLSFDSIGFSPSTPRRASPQKGRNRVSQASPKRSLTTRHSPRPSPKITRTHSDRRRSQSFDGPHSPILWGLNSGSFESPDMSKLFSSSSAASAPALAQPVEPSPSEHSIHSQTGEPARSHSASLRLSDQSGSSSTLKRTSWDASSTNDTASPSPPMTPEDHKAGVFPELPPLPTQVKAFNPPPSIPLPALPSTAPAPITPPAQISSALALPSLAPAATIREVEPEATKGEDRTPRISKPTLRSRSVAVIPDAARTAMSLARDMERALHS